MHMQREYQNRPLLLFRKIEPTGTIVIQFLLTSPILQPWKYAIKFHYLAEVTAAVSGAGLSGWGQCDIVRRNAALMLFVALLRDILLGQTPD